MASGESALPPRPAEAGELTQGLEKLRQHEPGALDRVVELLYDELRRLARQRLRGERKGQGLDQGVMQDFIAGSIDLAVRNIVPPWASATRLQVLATFRPAAGHHRAQSSLLDPR